MRHIRASQFTNYVNLERNCCEQKRDVLNEFLLLSDFQRFLRLPFSSMLQTCWEQRTEKLGVIFIGL